jgi:hypothetical protein
MNELTPSEPIGMMQQNIEGRTFENTLANARKWVVALDEIKRLAVSTTSITDWINQNGKPYLQWTGASKVARAFGVSYSLKGLSFEKEKFSDEHGEGVRIKVIGELSWNNSTVAEIGACTSRDDFFAMRKNKETGEKFYLPLSEIDQTDLEKKAMTNWLNRGVKSLLGLSFTWEELEQLSGGRISLQAVTSAGQSVTYGQGKKGGNTDTAESKNLREEIRKMILEIVGNNQQAAKDFLKNITSFTGKDGNTVAGKESIDALSASAVNVTYGKVKKSYEEFINALKQAEGSNQ